MRRCNGMSHSPTAFGFRFDAFSCATLQWAGIRTFVEAKGGVGVSPAFSSEKNARARRPCHLQGYRFLKNAKPGDVNRPASWFVSRLRVSRFLFPLPSLRKVVEAIISLERALPRASGFSSPQPTRGSDVQGCERGSCDPFPLFGLAAGGVYLAVRVTPNAVRSYRTISPLPFICQWSVVRGPL